MTGKFFSTGIAGKTFKSVLKRGLEKANPPALGVAVAYVSTTGLKYLQDITDKTGVEDVKLVTDTRDGITHPIALKNALSLGLDVRAVSSLQGTFHPKLYVGGEQFDDDAGIINPSVILVGSANLSAGGLLRNGECTYVDYGVKAGISASKVWKNFWDVGIPLTEPLLATYADFFAKRNRNRRPEDMVAFGVSDGLPEKDNGTPIKKARPPLASQKAISETSASVAWAGLQSFTGEYRLQLEFPKEAGLVLARILEEKSENGVVNICCSDGEARQFKFKFYDNNGMFRLNIPNLVPDADWARENKRGIGYVEVNDETNDIYFQVVMPGTEMMEIIDRSLALGTWGRTPTRLYGWY